METIEILSDKEAAKIIKKAKREIKEGRTVTLEELPCPHFNLHFLGISYIIKKLKC